MDFRTVILPHRDALYRQALRITLHTAAAEDAVQETMIRAWERRDEWPMIKNMGAWLSIICRNIALDMCRHRARTVSLPAASLTPHDASPDVGGSSADELRRIEARDTLAYIARLAQTLPQPQDEVFRLRDIEGLSYRDIAARLGISEDQVRVYLHRARNKIREQIVKKS